MKKSAVAIAVFAALTPAWQAQAATPSDPLASCGGITESQARLECFDRELAKSRPAAATPPAAVPKAANPAPASAPPAVAPAAAASAAASASLGDEQLKKKTDEPRELHARLTSQKELGSSRTYNLFLDNGQVWRHENSHLGEYLREGEAITITKAGGVGSYRLTRDAGASKDWIRVSRVR